ncbi:MAG: flagellar motor switch protein FliN [Actinobacteria bacterium]|uniref:Unannotated protein n=1 Tax=freshwater metagenome TaxID=449393 RepID=A0A6J6QZ44_9ZZZZ|nr:flagellar motor switch protein FliN [Actinomycetota bacterium]
MTAVPIDPARSEGEYAAAIAAAVAAASVLPSSEELSPGDPQPGTEHVTRIFASSVVADLTGAVTGRIAILVGQELTDALAASPLGGLDLASAVQPALDAAAVALGASAQVARQVDLDLLIDDLGGDFTAVPLLGSQIAAAVLVPDTTLAAVAGTPTSSAAAVATTAPVTGADGLAGQPLPALPATPAPSGFDNVRTIDGRRGIEMLHGVEMEVTVELGRTRMAVRDLLALAPGAVLALDRAAGSPADLLVNGRLIARGEVVVVDEDFGLRVTEILDDSTAG